MTRHADGQGRGARAVLVGLVGVVLALGAAAAVGLAVRPDGSAPAPAVPAPLEAPAPAAQSVVRSRPAVRAARVLGRWDRRRAAAYTTGDVAALRALYLPRRRVAEADASLLRSYVERGLTVRGVVPQVVEVAVVHQAPARLRLRVRERLPPTQVRSTEERRALPPGGLHVHEVTLVRRATGWKVAAVASRRTVVRGLVRPALPRPGS